MDGQRDALTESTVYSKNPMQSKTTVCTGTEIMYPSGVWVVLGFN
jgi:hypothetical protein